MTFDTLPIEIKFNILKYLSYQDYLRLMLTSKDTNKIYDNDSYKELLMKLYDKYNINYKKTYNKLFLFLALIIEKRFDMYIKYEQFDYINYGEPIICIKNKNVCIYLAKLSYTNDITIKI